MPQPGRDEPDQSTTAGGDQAPRAAIRLVVAADQHLIRGALVALLERETDLRVLAETGDGERVTDLVREHEIQVAVLDLADAAAGSIEVAQALVEAAPACRSLVISVDRRPTTLVRALAAGAAGFVSRDEPATALSEAVRAVHRGETRVDPALAAAALVSPGSPLTLRETEVLKIAASGASVEQIARRLALSSGTVRNYLSAAIVKLGARNRLDAVRIGHQHGWWQ